MVYPIESTKWEARVKDGIKIGISDLKWGQKRTEKCVLEYKAKPVPIYFGLSSLNLNSAFQHILFFQDPWHFWNRSLEIVVCQDEKSLKKK